MILYNRGGDNVYELILEEEDFPYPTRIIIEFKTYNDALEYIKAEKDKGDTSFVSLIRKTK